jgi:hypothetical protein
MPVDEIQELRSLGALEMDQVLMSCDNDISTMVHPEYEANVSNWYKWRLVKKSGDDFIEAYLEKFSKRESDVDFTARKNITYVPAFAKAGVTDIKNSIFQRIPDVTREGGLESYQNSVEGKKGGVDLIGSDMNSYVGRVILPELLAMQKIGVFVDMPELRGSTLMDAAGVRPYLYSYVAEDILNWSIDTKAEGAEFKSLLLRDHMFEDCCDGCSLPTRHVERYRLMWVQEGKTLVQFFDEESKPVDRFGNPGIDIIILDLPSIPFVQFEISESLYADVANYQIALMNMASSDVAYSLKSNYPFYVEQYDPRVDNVWARKATPQNTTQDDGVTIVRPGSTEQAAVGENKEIIVGVASGRRVPKGLDYPEFKHPSSEPLMASMKKQEEIKKDIRLLINLAVTNIQPKMASAESKGYDERSLEAGLSYIGIELEHGERQIAKYWTWYQDRKGNVPTVIYPKKYHIKTDKDKREEASKLLETAEVVPSLTYKKEALKKAVELNIGSDVSNEVLERINKEIDAAEVLFSDPDTLSKDIEQGLISLDSASKAKTYPDDEVEKAKEDHAERIKRIAESQAQARGTPDLGGIANASKSEKQDQDMKSTVPQDPSRGEGK